MKTLKLLLASLLVMALVFPTAAMAKDTAKAGKITSTAGAAEVKKNGGSKKFKAFKGMAITQGDTIITGSGGKIVMDLDSDKEVTIGSGTTLVVSELVKSAKALNGKTSLSLLKGKVVIKIKKKLDGDSRFEIETPTAIMGVMGTEFVVQYEDEQSYVGVFEGKVRTSYSGERKEVDPYEQLLLDRLLQGEVEPIDYRDLPLIGLELYLEKLEQDPNASQTLINQIKQEIAKMVAVEKAATDNVAGTPTNSTIVYEDTATNAPAPAQTPVVTPPTPTPSSEPTPTPSSEPTDEPTASPDPSDEPTPTPTEEPTPTPIPVPPLFDTEAFYNDMYSYVLNDQVFILPFSTELAWNEENVTLPADRNEAVELEVYDAGEHSFTKLDVIQEVSINPNNTSQLLIKLAEEIDYNSRISFTVLENKLVNKETGDAQTEAVVTVSPQEQKGFWFRLDLNTQEVTFKLYGEDGNREISFQNLGYEVSAVSVQKVCQQYPGMAGTQSLAYDEDYCGEEEDVQADLEEMLAIGSDGYNSTVEFMSEYFNSYDRSAASYEFVFAFHKGEETVDELTVLVHVIPPNPPYLQYDESHMLTLDSFVLEFSSPIEFVEDEDGGTMLDSIELQLCPPFSEGCGFFPLPIEGEEGNEAVPAMEIESVEVDPANTSRIIVTLKEELEYWDSFSVVVLGGYWRNSETEDIQLEDQYERLTVRANIESEIVEFTEGQTGSDHDIEIKLNTVGRPIVQASLLCLCEDFEEPYNVEDYLEITGDDDLKVIKLKASYFADAERESSGYNLVIRVYADQDAVDRGDDDIVNWVPIIINRID